MTPEGMSFLSEDVTSKARSSRAVRGDTEMVFVLQSIHEASTDHREEKLDARGEEAAWPLEKGTRQRDVFPKHSV